MGTIEVDTANIASGAITSAQIADASVTNAKISGTLQSSTFSSGSAGWRLEQNGDAEVNNLTVRADMLGTNSTVLGSGSTNLADGTFYIRTPQTLASTALSYTEGKVMVIANCDTDSQGVFNSGLTYQVLRNGTVISEMKDIVAPSGARANISMVAWDTSTGTGSRTYTLRCLGDSGASPTATMKSGGRTIVAIEFKQA